MLSRTRPIAALLGAVVVVGAGATAGLAQDEGNNDVRPLKANQTEGYFDGQNQVFTYAQNFHCTVEAFDDLDGLGRQGDGVPAAADPDEMILPECISGETRGGSEPTIDPTGTPVGRPASSGRSSRCSTPTGTAFPRGSTPPCAWTSSAPSRARRPPRRRVGSAAARCTPASCSLTRSSTRSAWPSTGLAVPNPTAGLPVLPGTLPIQSPVALPTVGPGVLVPLPSHSHIVETEIDDQSWWQVVVVLVKDPAVWPDLDGNCAAGRDKCLTSLDALRASQAGDGSGRDIPTNIWLFFANEPRTSPGTTVTTADARSAPGTGCPAGSRHRGCAAPRTGRARRAHRGRARPGRGCRPIPDASSGPSSASSSG